jgi:peptidyl-prolyl cis-trans isomerase SurA
MEDEPSASTYDDDRSMPMTSALTAACRLARLVLPVMVMIAGAPIPVSAQQVVVMVNGDPITALDIEQRMKFLSLTSGGKTHSRQEVIEELINERLKISEGKKFKLSATDTEVETTYAGMATRMGATSEQLTQKLNSVGAGGTLKNRIRSEIVWGQLVRGRYQSTLQVGEKEIVSALETRKKDDKDATKDTSYDYTLRPILFIVAKGSPPAAFEARRREAEALKTRFQNCEEGINFARGLRDVAVRAPVLRSSGELPTPLRTLLDGMQVGRLTNPEQTAQGIEVFALCGKKQSIADSAGRREARDEIFAQRFQTQANTYLKQIRASAMIEYR